MSCSQRALRVDSYVSVWARARHSTLWGWDLACFQHDTDTWLPLSQEKGYADSEGALINYRLSAQRARKAPEPR